ncbi:adenosine 3'-phospho 5'-phosphosulfate transporter 1 [Chrysoperla carnea]|uniref:adenosine 3'-phospho 5'-phosphosulfate transporter 1 n=1 Tax=Chrysoperla carnea TaxID=189513 RepID=UPI001D07BEE8|nr:adenosine 3'-phospho 5'-phosphosulfate transporter 1 [Chrysoperla carnea]
MNQNDIQITFLLLMSSTGIFIISSILVSSLNEIDTEYNWLIHLLLNVITYGTVILPGVLTFIFIKQTNYREKSGHGLIPNIIKSCLGSVVDGEDEYDDALRKAMNPPKPQTTTPRIKDNLLLLLCALGLQVFYLSWGILQEKVMTQKYIDESDQNKEYQFKDSQFLVFVNRILALIMSGWYIWLFKQPSYYMPFYKYIYCSFSNIMSSWCQYEALKFVSFPTQVLAKASKVIPVMIMGKIVSGKKFPNYEYYTAGIMSVGMLFFMLEAPNNNNKGTVTTFSGVTLLIMYIVLDSFTSNWQDALFKKYHMSSVQMMFGVNLFSCLFTAVSLFQQNEFISSLLFMYKFPSFTLDCLTLSVCSAAGQLLIFYTISKFGPVTFALIMTVRQFLAVFLSCLIYKHNISYLGIIGVSLVFGSVFLRYYCKQRCKISNVIIKT